MSETSLSGLSEQKAALSGEAIPTTGKKISFLSMMAICIGLVIVQGSMITATQGIGLGGTAFIAAMFAAFILAQCNALSFSELSLMFPQEGTLATYTQKAIGHFPAIVSVFSGYVVVAMLAIPVEMFLVGAIIGELLPGVFPEYVIPFSILALFAFTNYLGADVFAKVQNVLAFVLVLALVLIGLCAITGAVEPHPEVAGTTIDWSFVGVLDGSFVGMIAMAMWLMVGVEFICPMINEVKNPEKTIPRAMILSLTAMLFIFLIFVSGIGFYMSTETLLSSPIPYLDYASAVFGQSGLIFAAVMAIAATCSTVNTVLAGVPRMLHGMAENKQAFPQMKITSKKYGTPWVGILFMVVIIAIPVVLMGIDDLITMVIAASTSWLLAYVVAHINVLVLRRRLPHAERPYKSPFFPVPQIVGIVGMTYVALNNSPSPDMTALVYQITGGILLVVSIIAALWVKFYMKRGLFQADNS